jgi:hypothetical protein
VLALISFLAAGSLIPSTFWFARGLQATGNPIYPLELKIAGHVIFSGVTPSHMMSSHYDLNFVSAVSQWPLYPWTEWKRNPGYLLVPYSTGDGFGGSFATFVPLALVLAFYSTLVRHRGGMLEGILLLNWLAMLIVWWTAMNRILRYGLPLWVMACIIAVGLFPILEAANARTYRALLVCSLLMTCVISSFVPVHDLSARIRSHIRTRAEFYNYPTIIDKLPAGSRILNLTGVPDMNFPLAGKNLSNLVVSGFEAPAELTPTFVRNEQLDYIVEFVGTEQNDGPPITGAIMVDDEVISAGTTKVRWLVWKVNHAVAVLSGSR